MRTDAAPSGTDHKGDEMERLSTYTKAIAAGPRGLNSGRFLTATALAKGNPRDALLFAEAVYGRDSPGVVSALKAAVDAVASTDPGGLTTATPIADEFLGLVRARSLLDRIAGFRNIPLNTSVLAFVGDATGALVAQGGPKPIPKFDLSRITMTPRKHAATVVVTDETLKAGNPLAEAALAQELAAALGTTLDRAFISPNDSGSVSYGVTTINSTGSALTQIDADLRALIELFSGADGALDTAVLVTSPSMAAHLAGLRGSGGSLAFPNVSLRSGGTVAGIPLFISAALAASGSPATHSIVLVDPAQVLVADENRVILDVAKAASLQVDDAPSDSPASQISLWQNHLIALRAERWITWKRGRDSAVAVLADISI